MNRQVSEAIEKCEELCSEQKTIELAASENEISCESNQPWCDSREAGVFGREREGHDIDDSTLFWT